MGGVILLGIVVLLIAILVTPALRARREQKLPPAVEPAQDAPHEVVVHRLDDHRGNKPGDGTKPS